MKSFNYKRGILLKIMLAMLPLYMQAQGLRVDDGAHVVVSGSANLVFNNAGFINNGNFTAGESNVIMTGNNTTAGSFVGGSRKLALYTIVIDKDVNDVLLGNNIDVFGSVVMRSGNLQLNKYTLDLGSIGSITGERNISCITGKDGGLVKASAVVYSHVAVNPGNIGVEINSETNAGLTVITRGHIQQESGNGSPGIQRYFDIAPPGNADLRANLRFFYLSGELAGNAGNELSVLSNADGMRWSVLGKDKADAQNGWVLKNNIGSMHRFTLAVPDNKMLKQGLSGTLVQTYPNPARDAFTIMVNTDKEKDIVVVLYDQQGRYLEAKRVHCFRGANRLTWDIQQYAAGSYQLVFNDPNIKNVKIEKQ